MRLFRRLDTLQHGLLSVHDIVRGLSGQQVLSGLRQQADEQRDQWLRDIFNACDVSRTGMVSFEEMRRYLLSVFLVMRQQDLTVFQEFGYDVHLSLPACNPKAHLRFDLFMLLYHDRVSPDELAAATTRQCFMEVDRDGDGLLSFADFKVRMRCIAGLTCGAMRLVFNCSPQRACVRMLCDDRPGMEHRTTSSSSAPSRNTPRLPCRPSHQRPLCRGSSSLPCSRCVLCDSRDCLFSLLTSFCSGYVAQQELANLVPVVVDRPDRLRQLFRVHAPNGLMSREGFHRLFQEIAEPSADRYRVRALAQDLFQFLDIDGNGVVDTKELISGLTLLSNDNNKDSAVRATFAAYDVNGDGFVSKEEMCNYLTGMFRMMLGMDRSKFLLCVCDL
jgi:Ca2+-binding EF-hand superfamily protein